MNGLALDSGEFISADELNARWLPRKATEEEMSKEQPEALPVRLAKRLCDGISTGHDWPNTDDELLRMQSAAELRRLHAENEALRAQIGQCEPVAWQPIEAAPRDGTEILLMSDKGRVANGMWVAVNSAKGYWAWPYVNLEPAKWTQLPLLCKPPRQPLLASDIVMMYDENPRSDSEMIAFARAIEAAHNIGEKK